MPGTRDQLVRQRHAMGMTKERLAAQLGVERSTIYRWESGESAPRPDLQLKLARALGLTPAELMNLLTPHPASPELADALLPLAEPDRAHPTPMATPTSDDRARIARSIATPSRVDAKGVQALADILASQRRLDDSFPAADLLPASLAHWESVEWLAREARGQHAESLHYVAAEWLQFLGWLHAEARNDREAIRFLTEAEERADDLGDGPLAAQAANFKGYLARQQRRPRAVVRWFLAAYHTPGAAPLQRVGDAVQAAHGYALLDERDAARRLLGDAETLASDAADTTPPETAYWLSPTFSRMGIGLARLALGDRTDAVEHLQAGLDGLPPEQREAEWTQEYIHALENARSA